MSERCAGRCSLDLANADYWEAEASTEANEGVRGDISPWRIVSFTYSGIISGKLKFLAPVWSASFAQQLSVP